ncbi:MAG: retroviral-like aspartic protease family protein, partial [Omnitrophica bacterium]|nr:retroviral-like aspartic protease family protein [Candidatus Omnitrophota bacterium]
MAGVIFFFSHSREFIKINKIYSVYFLNVARPLFDNKKGSRHFLSEEEKARAEVLKKYRLERYEKEVEAAKKARGRIKIKFLDNRFGVVNVTLNKKLTVPMLADTGASMVVISRDVANRLGLKDLDEKGKIVAILADGSSTRAIPITLDSIQVGSSSAKNIRAAVTETPPGAGIDGLLGMTFLGNFHVKMDAKENSLVLEKY